ncbi:MAG: prepilin-type N-terminal cleavage/methylation domain-containing protein [Opitutales bacterium]|nr:prepilin-type N-terminal cleavage/methylation domain-containing protein [Opitutales bacterium]
MFISSYPKRRGFTLIELLTVIAIIGILAAILLPAVNRVRESARRADARSTVGQIETGFQQFLNAYEEWPTIENVENAPEDENAILFEGEWIQALTAEDRDAARDAGNTRVLVLFEHPEPGESELLDRWGNAYRVRLDTTYRGILENLPNTETEEYDLTLRRNIAVWSIAQGDDGGIDVSRFVTSWD